MLKNFNIFYFDKKFIKIFLLLNNNQNIYGKNQILFKKNSFIFKLIKGKNYYIYNGNNFRCLNIKYFYIGLRIGNFIFTRKPFKYIEKKKIQKKKTKR